MAIQIAVDGIPEALNVLNLDFNQIGSTVTLAIAQAIQNELAPYPPATAANNPRPGSYYVRGQGQYYQSKRTGATRLVRHSETLGRRWVVRRDGLGGAVLMNDASYAQYVHGTVNRNQSRVMARIGWQNTRDAVKRVFANGTVDRIVQSAVRRKR